jgi:hypothetical protein
MNILVRYKAKWQLKSAPHYKWTNCKKLINTRTNNEIKKTLKGSKAGYWIGKNFIQLSDLSKKIELISEKEILPF